MLGGIYRGVSATICVLGDWSVSIVWFERSVSIKEAGAHDVKMSDCV